MRSAIALMRRRRSSKALSPASVYADLPTVTDLLVTVNAVVMGLVAFSHSRRSRFRWPGWADRTSSIDGRDELTKGTQLG